LYEAHHIAVVQRRCPLKSDESLGQPLQGQVELSQVLPHRRIFGCELNGSGGGVQGLTELTEIEVTLAELLPCRRISWLLSCPFRGVNDEEIPVAGFLQHLNPGDNIFAGCVLACQRARIR